MANRVLMLFGLIACATAAMLMASTSGAQAPPSKADGLEAWEKAFEVFSHPRCVNCHVPEDNRPRWSGPSYGAKAQYHGMNIIADDTRKKAAGLPCTSCHGVSNLPFAKGAPGAPHWALAPVEMVWWAKSSRDICEQIKDPARNGDKSLDEVVEHVRSDDLVQWGWNPGPGREPAPYSSAELADFLRNWVNSGAPCPVAG